MQNSLRKFKKCRRLNCCATIPPIQGQTTAKTTLYNICKYHIISIGIMPAKVRSPLLKNLEGRNRSGFGVNFKKATAPQLRQLRGARSQMLILTLSL